MDIAVIWDTWSKEFSADHGACAELEDFKDGRLIIKVNQPLHMHRMSFVKNDLKSKLNEAVGKELINEIVFKHG